MAIAVAPNDDQGPDSDAWLDRLVLVATGIVIGLLIYAMLDAYVF